MEVKPKYVSELGDFISLVKSFGVENGTKIRNWIGVDKSKKRKRNYKKRKKKWRRNPSMYLSLVILYP